MAVSRATRLIGENMLRALRGRHCQHYAAALLAGYEIGREKLCDGAFFLESVCSLIIVLDADSVYGHVSSAKIFPTYGSFQRCCVSVVSLTHHGLHLQSIG